MHITCSSFGMHGFYKDFQNYHLLRNVCISITYFKGCYAAAMGTAVVRHADTCKGNAREAGIFFNSKWKIINENIRLKLGVLILLAVN